MVKGRVKEVFPGGNTSQGFFSFYDYIIPTDATRIMIIKGGPGVGKSSFMKAIAEDMNEQGFDVELHHCSSDNNSIDGVVFPQLNVAMIDGTSPHVVDPKNPGAVDEIIHLGDYWNEQGMRQNKTQVMELNTEVGRSFRRAYQYVKAAKVIHDDLETIYGEGLDYGVGNQEAANLIKTIFADKPIAEKVGKLRKLFASAITPEGFQNFLPSIFENISNIYLVTGVAGSGKSTLINKLASAAIERGFDCEGYYCAFDPLKIEHLLIEELGVGIITSVFPHKYELKVGETIDMNVGLAGYIETKYNKIIEDDLRYEKDLLNLGISYIQQAKKLHDEMEQYYIPNMDFEAISELREKTLKRIIGYAEEKMVLIN